MMMAELFKEAGIPDGCFNVIHGQHDTVNFICDNPDIKAVSFVGGNRAVSVKYLRYSAIILNIAKPLAPSHWKS